MLRFFTVAIAFVVMAGNNDVHADLITYNMTGTITSTYGHGKLPFNIGDHVTWTLQYNPSTPSSYSVGNKEAGYPMTGPIITNIFDQTTGFHFHTPAFLPLSGIGLTNTGMGSLTAADSTSTSNTVYGSYLYLNTTSLPTVDLANLNLGSIPWGNTPGSPSYLNYMYDSTFPGNAVDERFTATASVVQAPEPGSFTLFLLGVTGLAVRRFRSRLSVARRRA